MGSTCNYFYSLQQARVAGALRARVGTLEHPSIYAGASPALFNPDHGCHDIRVEDLDGDGKVDAICSGSISLRAPRFVAFQNDRHHWQGVYKVANGGDGIAALRIGNDPTPHLVGASFKGDVFWYENPRLKGGDAPTSPSLTALPDESQRPSGHHQS